MESAEVLQRLAAVTEQAQTLRRETAQSPTRPAAEFTGHLDDLERALAELRAAGEDLCRSRDEASAGQQRYHSLFEFAPDGYLITDAAGVVREANWTTGILLNTPAEGLVGRSIEQFIAAAECASFRAQMEQLEAVTGVREWETRLQPPNAAPVDVTVTVSPERDGTGGLLVLRWLLRDITARKQATEQVQRLTAELEQRVRERTAQLEAANQRLLAEVEERTRAEEALRESQARVSAIIASAMDAIITVDSDQRVVLFNTAAEAMFRTPAASAVGQPLDRFIPPRHQRAHAEHIQRFRQTGVTSRQMGTLGQLSGIRSDGAEFPIEASISQTQSFGQTFFTVIIRDVTARVESDRVLQARARQQAAVAELGQRGLAGTDLPTLLQETATSVAHALDVEYAAVLQLQPDGHTLELSATHGWPPGADPQALHGAPGTLLDHALRTAAPVAVPDLSAETAFQSPLAASVGARSALAAVVPHGAGAPWGMLAALSKRVGAFEAGDANFLLSIANVLSTALERQRAEAEIRSLNASLERRVAERTAELEAKNRELETFTYSVSHDLKAPLRGIEGYSRLLVEDYAGRLEAEGQHYLDSIRRAVVHMGALIDDLLTYSRLERREVVAAPLRLRELIDALIAERMNELNARGVQVSVNVPCEFVNADLDGLAQAIRNLIDNAIKFTHDVPSPRIEFYGTETDTSCVLRVCDNGIGFDMQYHDRIFGIFQRLHRAEDYPGTGIGLAIVQKAMARMRGRVWAESAEGRGACFFLELPK